MHEDEGLDCKVLSYYDETFFEISSNIFLFESAP